MLSKFLPTSREPIIVKSDGLTELPTLRLGGRVCLLTAIWFFYEKISEDYV